ncbi:ATP-binding protein [Streptomyces sp. P9(2023)]|uniref:ATP-binding protein n=1 Tax=Streptomyces sp. P9(2023) TaxID=3064394 RepID=UPI0028F45A69|nr:ATP-binding protein [Streptomyces sp. P9(2023)]MDT9692167.1 ATP-binding protein [Streptomyces sp. P9(2023)]
MSVETVILRWAQGPRSVPMARRRLVGVLEYWGLGCVADSASLVLSELLTNAVRHGRVPGREIETRFARLPGVVRIEVHDASERRPMTALPSHCAGGGWGLPLVDMLAAKWGVSARCGPGKVVWAELVIGEVDGEPQKHARPPE